MGYSIGVEARNSVLRDRMLRFTNREYRRHGQLLGMLKLPSYSTEPRAFGELSYSLAGGAKAARVLGLDYGSGLYGFEREYAYAVVRWMALKVGARRRVFTDPALTFPRGVPCLLTEDSVWPIVVSPKTTVAPELAWCCTDELGVPLLPEDNASRRELTPREWGLLRSELARLDERWSKVVR